MKRLLSVWVHGVPQPQGSMSVNRKGKLFHKPALIAWRERVLILALNAAQRQGWPDNWDGLVEVDYVFYLPKPKQPRFKWYPGVKPDLDKLIRAVNDALSPKSPRRVVEEDSRIIRITAEKRYATKDQPPGVCITLRQLDSDTEFLWGKKVR